MTQISRHEIIDQAQDDIIVYRDLFTSIDSDLSREISDHLADADVWMSMALYWQEQGRAIRPPEKKTPFSSSPIDSLCRAIVLTLIDDESPDSPLPYDFITRLGAIRDSCSNDAEVVMTTFLSTGQTTWRRIDAALLVLRLLSITKVMCWHDPHQDMHVAQQVISVVGSTPRRS